MTLTSIFSGLFTVTTMIFFLVLGALVLVVMDFNRYKDEIQPGGAKPAAKGGKAANGDKAPKGEKAGKEDKAPKGDKAAKGN